MQSGMWLVMLIELRLQETSRASVLEHARVALWVDVLVQATRMVERWNGRMGTDVVRS